MISCMLAPYCHAISNACRSRACPGGAKASAQTFRFVAVARNNAFSLLIVLPTRPIASSRLNCVAFAPQGLDLDRCREPELMNLEAKLDHRLSKLFDVAFRHRRHRQAQFGGALAHQGQRRL